MYFKHIPPAPNQLNSHLNVYLSSGALVETRRPILSTPPAFALSLSEFAFVDCESAQRYIRVTL